MVFTSTAEDVEVGWDARTVSLRGNAELYGVSEQDPERWVRITADLIEGNLATGRFEALGGVLMFTERATMGGEALVFNANTSEFQLRRGGLAVALDDKAAEPVYGFAYGRELYSQRVGERRDQVVHLVGARFTTCERVDPHFALEAGEMVLDTSTRRLQVRDAAVRLYGVRVPLLPYFWTYVGGGPGGSELIPQASYTSRDGLALSWGLPIAIPQRQITTSGALRLTTRRGVRAELDMQGPLGGMTGHLRASVKEEVLSDFEERSLVDRLPELALGNAWQTDLFGGTQLDAQLAVGWYKQRGAEGEPDVSDGRALASVRFGHNYEGQRQGTGQWWWVAATEQLYFGGGDYTILEAGVGAGGRLTDRLGGWLSYRYRYHRGASPFEFDDVDVPQLLSAGMRWDLDENWTLGASGYYDLDEGAVRDYRLELGRRVHCLTWKLWYRSLTGGVGLGIGLNGITPGDRSGQQWQLSDGPPDVWAHAAPDTGENTTVTTE